MGMDFCMKQINEIARVSEAGLGLADMTGNVRLCSDGLNVPFDNIFSAFPEIRRNKETGYVTGGYAFYLADIGEEEQFYLFTEAGSGLTEKENTIKFLKVAAFCLKQSYSGEKERHSEVIDSIFNGTYTEKLEKNAVELLGSNLVEAKKLTVFVILPKNTASPEEIESILSLTKEIIPSEWGAFGTERDINGKRGIAFICCDEENAEDGILKETLGSVADTILSETLTEVWVSSGGTANGLRGVSVSFAEACEGISIGRTFGLQVKLFDYDTMSLERLIYHMPVKYSEEFVRETLGPDFFSDRSAYELLNTVDTFLECNQNVSEAARALYVHRNTMTYRLDKFMKTTGLDCSKFSSGLRIKLVMLILKSIAGDKQEQ